MTEQPRKLGDIAEAWAVAEHDGWAVVALVRHKSAPEDRRWRCELVNGRNRIGAYGASADSALRNATARITGRVRFDEP